MFYYFVIYPVLLAVSVVWPIMCSLHGLQKKDANETKAWLYYWLGFVLFSTLANLPIIGMVIDLPFTILAAIVGEIYYETGVIVAILLLNPKMRYLDVVVQKADALMAQHGDKVSSQVMTYLKKAEGQFKDGIAMVRSRVTAATGGKTGKK